MNKILVPTHDGGIHTSEDVALADYLITLKQQNQTDFWPVMDAVIEAFQKKFPHKWAAYVIDIEDTRRNTYNDFGEAKKSKTKGTGNLRRTLDLPYFVDRAMRMLYSADELPFDKAFYHEVWKRYPMFRVSAKS